MFGWLNIVRIGPAKDQRANPTPAPSPENMSSILHATLKKTGERTTGFTLVGH